MTAQLIGEELEAPTDVAITIEGADAAVFTVDERLAFVKETGDVIKAGANESRTDDFINVSFGLFVIVDIKMPGVNVCIGVEVVLKMFPMDHAHVLDEAGGIECFGQLPHRLDP